MYHYHRGHGIPGCFSRKCALRFPLCDVHSEHFGHENCGVLPQ